MKEQVMENPHSVSSPRRVLSFSKRRKTSAAFPDSGSDKHSSGFGVSGDHGPKTSEVYGFVGSITTVVATELGFKFSVVSFILLMAVIFLVWAYVPEPWLHSIGIHYYPNRYWAIAVPTYAMVTVVLALLFYIGLNFMATPPVTSYNMIFDEFSREPAELAPSTEEDELPIEPISDIGINRINDLMFGDAK